MKIDFIVRRGFIVWRGLHGVEVYRVGLGVDGDRGGGVWKRIGSMRWEWG